MNRLFFLGTMETGFVQRVLRGMVGYGRERRPRWQVRWGEQLPRDVVERHDGVVVFAVKGAVLKKLRETGMPVVATSTRLLGSGVPCVVTDDEAIGGMAAEFFRSKFYRSFAFVGPSVLDFSVSRRKGFLAGLGEAGCRTIWTDGLEPGAGRRDLLREKLEKLPPATGILAANDTFARQVIEALEDSPRRVPADLAVLGVDADEFVRLSSPVDLSSVDSAPEAIGARAAELLGRMLEEPGLVPPGTMVRVSPVGVVEGDSTGAFGTGDELVLRAMGLLREHAYEREFSIQQLAAGTGCSRRLLEQRFTASTGMGPSAHLWHLRMEHARDLLARTNLPIAEVADQSGFASPYHFSERFKRVLGLTPREFRMRGSG